MALITGNMLMFDLTPPTAHQPILEFVPSGPAVGINTSIFPSKPPRATIASDGTWQCELAVTTGLRPVTWFTPRVSTLDPDFYATATGFTRVDYLNLRLFVPAGGGRFQDLVDVDGAHNPMIVFWQATEPDPFPIGSVWVNTVTGDVNRRKA